MAYRPVDGHEEAPALGVKDTGAPCQDVPGPGTAPGADKSGWQAEELHQQKQGRGTWVENSSLEPWSCRLA